MNTELEPRTILGQLLITGPAASPLPLQKTIINGQVTGPLLRLEISQHFTNPFPDPLELTYLFPLPHKAAVTGFELKIGDRRIYGDIQEIEQARQAYTQALEAGKQAGLLEQRRPNLFAIRIGNVLPGELIQASMQLQNRISLLDGNIEIVIPMGLTQRYHTADAPQEVADTDTSFAPTGEKIGTVEINLSVDGGLPVGDPVSPTHTLRATRLDARRFQVSLDKETIPNRDFILRYTLPAEAIQASVWTSHDTSGDFFLVNLFPPAIPETYAAPRREFVFVLDRSGSMSGQPILQARNALRACLRSLNPGDIFRILLFDDKVDWYQQAASEVTQSEIDAADTFLNQVEGRGGTEILAALEAVFQLKPDPTRPRYIIFLTDGAVSAEERALKKVREKIGQARLFTFGLGPSVNRALLSQLARHGRGSAEFLQLDEDIEGSIIRFQDRVSFPMLTDVSLSCQGARVWDVYPSALPDLYAGEPLELIGKIKVQQSGATLVLKGKQAGKPVEQALLIPVSTDRDNSVERVWARARVDDLLDQASLDSQKSGQVRSEIISLAFQHSLTTPYTAFVAIDEESSGKAAVPRRVLQISQPLPEGLDRSGFGPVGGSRMFMKMMPPSPAPSQPANLIHTAASFISLSTNLDMRKVAEDQGAISSQAPNNPAIPVSPEPPILMETSGFSTRQEALRWLARTQDVDGSWNKNLEMTAAALLAFIRAGHTNRSGNFRQIVRRALIWLESVPSINQGTYFQALVLSELAEATGAPADTAAAIKIRARLPAPTSPVDQVICDRIEKKTPSNLPPSGQIATLDDLRLAAILTKQLPIDNALFQASSAELARVWAAVLL